MRIKNTGWKIKDKSTEIKLNTENKNLMFISSIHIN